MVRLVLFLLGQILTEWRGRCKLPAGGVDIGALALEVVGNRPPQRWVGNVMRGVGGGRQITAGQLVLALGAGLHALEPVRNGVVDRLVVAELEVQERVVLERSPVAAIEGVGSDE